MVHRPSDFAAHRIDWGNKADNLRAIAEDLNIGLDAICFLDENPNERALIRRFLPEVIVPELPEDPAAWVDYLRDRWELQALRVTDEDRNRAATIRTAVDVRRRSAEAVDLDDFLRSLELRVEFEPLADRNRERIAQLHAKTNQFNATTRRYGSAELAVLAREGALVYGVRTSGKFDPSEVNAALVLVPTTHEGEPAFEIASLLYSCRIAGRRLEEAILAFAADSARELGARYLLAEIVPTERNAPIRGLYDREGFERLAAGRSVLDLEAATLQIPDCYAVTSA
jgi:FkbH-like protein